MARKMSSLEKFDELSAQNRQMLARNTGNNKKSLARYDELTAKSRAKVASRSSGYDKIAHDEKVRNARAVRTGGQW